MAAKKAIIIGGGIAGLAAAIRLKVQGNDVSLFEASDQFGGKMGEINSEGFRWDSGPSLFTMPQFVEELFLISNKKMADYIPYQKQEVICNYFWDDQTSFQMKANLNESYKELSTLFNEPIERVKDYFDRSLQKYQLTAPIFIERSLHKASTYLKRETFSALFQSAQLDINTNLHELNAKWFENPKLIQLLDRFATYNGSSPYKTSGIMSMIPSLEMHYGTYFPEGGMRSIAEGLYQLGNELGVEYRANEKVEQIAIENRKVKGIQSSLGYYNANIVVCNMDVKFAYQKLLKNYPEPKSLEKTERSSSALIFYWGINRSFSQLDLHNIFFSSSYKEEFEAIFENGDLHSDPTVYINISSKERTEDAPEGMENWFVMINAPAHTSQDWTELKKQARKNIMEKLSKVLDVEIEPMIVTERTLDPVLIEEKTSSYGGSLYGSSSNSKTSAFLRHPNFSKRINNLYFVGGSVHPGGGIPLCLQSAKIVSELIDDK